MYVRRSLLKAAAIAAAFVAATSTADAQASNYPAFEMPRIERRAFNFAFADGDAAGTQLLAQWREGMSPRMQLGMDLGFGEPDGPNAESYFFLGGTMGYKLASASADMPLDVMLAAGLGLTRFDLAGESANLFRIPVGVSVGHRFPLEKQMAITPFAHPRLIIDHCSEDCIDGDATGFGLGFDLGVNFDLNASTALRMSISLANGEMFDDEDAFGLGFVWRPAGSRTSRR